MPTRKRKFKKNQKQSQSDSYTQRPNRRKQNKNKASTSSEVANKTPCTTIKKLPISKKSDALQTLGPRAIYVKKDALFSKKSPVWKPLLKVHSSVGNKKKVPYHKDLQTPKTKPTIIKKKSTNNPQSSGGIKRLYSPFNKFLLEKPVNKIVMPPGPFIRRQYGLSPKERGFLICSCQSKSVERYQALKAKAADAIKYKKIFTVYGCGGAAIRKALVERGWVEKIPPNHMNLSKIRQGSYNSQCEIDNELERLLLSNLVEKQTANFLWGYKGDLLALPVANGQESENNPLRNKLQIDGLWATKQGLCKSMQESYWYYIEGVSEVIAPRTYNTAEGDEISEVIDDYKLTACTSLLKWILSMIYNEKQIFSQSGRISNNVIVFALNRCKEYLFMKQNRDIDKQTNTTATNGQWNSFLKQYYLIINKTEIFQSDVENKLPLYIAYAKILLKQIHKYRPQLSCEGCHNIWIIKPGAYSRGRGIRMASKLGVIVNLINKGASKYVVQKYIEEPLLIYGTKFDIRQYYLITSTYPLVIWMYEECYLKFSSQKYSLQDFHESIHLTNNAIQRKYKICPERSKELPVNNMWDLNTFKDYLCRNGREMVWDNLIYPSMKKSIVAIMLSCQDSLHHSSNNRFELYGCDFILDKDYKPWLIEINSSPDLNPTTAVTAKICPEVVSDVIKVVIDYANDHRASTGKFEMCYREELLTPRYCTQNLVVEGHALPLGYFYRGIIVCPSSPDVTIDSEKPDMRSMITKLNSVYDYDLIMKQPEQDVERHHWERETCTHTSKSEEDLNTVAAIVTEQLEELLDKITSDYSFSPTKVSSTDFTSTLSSGNLARKGFVEERPRSVTDVNTFIKKSVSRFASSETLNRSNFESIEFDDGSKVKRSMITDAAPSVWNVVQSLNRGKETHYNKIESNDLIKRHTIVQNTKINKCNSKQMSPDLIVRPETKLKAINIKQRTNVDEITRKIFQFLENKEKEYSKKV